MGESLQCLERLFRILASEQQRIEIPERKRARSRDVAFPDEFERRAVGRQCHSQSLVANPDN